MSKIKIKNFGPIKEGYLKDDGFLDIKKVTIFIGNQGSGKSTVAKLIAMFIWLEKALNKGDIKELRRTDFWNFSEYHGILEYFYIDSEVESEIQYCGDTYSIKYFDEDENPSFSKQEKKKYITPKIMYVPASRNTLSTISNIKGIPDNLLTFYEELRRANKDLKGKKLKLPINDYEYEFNEQTETSFIVGSGYSIDIKNASSGAQSFAPLYVVTQDLAHLVTQSDEFLRKNMDSKSILKMNEEMTALEVNDSIPESEKVSMRKKIRAKYLSKCFINIVEEPEQNLYPSSQRSILNSLLEFNNMSEGNKLIMTTHSPYILSYLTLAIKGKLVLEKIKKVKSGGSLQKKLKEIIPLKSVVSPDDVAIYQIDDEGNITKLDHYKGLPSDDNYLNNGLELTNDLFSQLLDLEDLCQ